MNTQNNIPASRNEEAVVANPNRAAFAVVRSLIDSANYRTACALGPEEKRVFADERFWDAIDNAEKFLSALAAPGAAIDAREQEAATGELQPMALKICSMLTDEMARLYPFTSKASHGLAKAEEVRVNIQAVRDVAQELNRKLLASCDEAPAASAQASPELLLGWKRYEKARKLSPFQWNRLHIRNLAGENFDEMIDSLPEPSTPVPAPSEALSPATMAQPVAWRLVPIEPTAAMIEAGASADPERESVWSAYLNAAPAQPCASQGCGGAAATVLSRADVDRIVYACRQSGDDSTYAIVNAALRAVLSTAKSGGGATPEGGEA